MSKTRALSVSFLCLGHWNLVLICDLVLVIWNLNSYYIFFYCDLLLLFPLNVRSQFFDQRLDLLALAHSAPDMFLMPGDADQAVVGVVDDQARCQRVGNDLPLVQGQPAPQQGVINVWETIWPGARPGTATCSSRCIHRLCSDSALS